MALVEVEKGPSEDRFWYPEQKGDYVEGYLYKFVKGDYGRQIELYKGFDEEENEYILQRLPAHADLKRTYANLIEDAFTRVEVVDVIPTKSKTGKPRYVYKVLQDVEDTMTFPDKEAADTGADDYYAE